MLQNNLISASYDEPDVDLPYFETRQVLDAIIVTQSMVKKNWRSRQINHLAPDNIHPKVQRDSEYDMVVRLSYLVIH